MKEKWVENYCRDAIRVVIKYRWDAIHVGASDSWTSFACCPTYIPDTSVAVTRVYAYTECHAEDLPIAISS